MKKIIFLALILRLLTIFLSRNIDNYDLQSYRLVGELTSKGLNIYPQAANLHHPYFPAFLYVEALAFWLGRLGVSGRLGAITIIKIIINLFDLGNLYLVSLLSKKNLKGVFLYAINPVSILIFCFHGQFDAIPIFFLLLTLYLIKVKKEKFSILIFSFAIMVKTWPALFLLSLYKRLKNKKLIIFSLVFPLISALIYSLIFRVSVLNILKTIIGYQGLWGIWGLWGKIRIRWQKLLTGIFLSSFFGYSYFFKKKNVIEEILELLFFFFTFTTNFSIQYFSWIMPFLAIVKSKYYWVITLSVTIFLIFTFLARSFSQITAKDMSVLGLILWFLLASIFLVAYRKNNLV